MQILVFTARNVKMRKFKQWRENGVVNFRGQTTWWKLEIFTRLEKSAVIIEFIQQNSKFVVNRVLAVTGKMFLPGF
jgi:hypothetical protein